MANKPEVAEVTEQAHSSNPKGRRRLLAFAIIYCCFLLTIAITAVSVGYWARERVAGTLRDEITRNLLQKAQMLANRVNADHSHNIDVIASQEGQAAGARATIVDSNGRVLADSEILATSLADEGRRAEFVTALHGSNGIETRTRNSVPVLYVAVPVSGGAVRLSYPLSEPAELAAEVDGRIFLGSAIAVVLALGISAILYRILPR